ncbi:MAG: sulfotransferase [Gemmatimonadota bacterium]
MSAGRLPDFLIIGAQKAGTTWLREQLRAHDDIFMPGSELHYFDHDDLYEKGPDWYANQFAAGADARLVGDKTPEYLYLPDRPDIRDGARRIHDLLPGARLIAVLRDPVTRALSAVNHMIHRHHISPLHSVDSLLVGRQRSSLPWPVIEMGMYHRQLARFVELFGRESVLTLYYEDDLVADPAVGLSRTCDFLGIERETHPDEMRRRPNRQRKSRFGLAVEHYTPVLSALVKGLEGRLPDYYPRLGEAASRALYEEYAPHNARLFDLVGRAPSSGWRFSPAGESG